MNRVSVNELGQRIGGRRGVPEFIILDSVPAICVVAAGEVRKDMGRQVSPDGTPYRTLAHPRPNGGAKALQDTGRLGQSVKATGKGRKIVLEASHPGAATHQYGATIRAKRGKFLAIPLTKEAKRIGSPRRNKFPRPLFVLHTLRGALFLAESQEPKSRAKAPRKRRTKKRPKLILHYILVKSVRVPARKFLGFSARVIDKAHTIIMGNAAAWFFGMLEGTDRR